MNKATLAGVHGAGEVHSRLASEDRREYRGTFAFRVEDTPALVRLLDSGEIVEYVGRVDRERDGLRVLVTDVSLDQGIAYFMGKGEPYVVTQNQASATP